VPASAARVGSFADGVAGRGDGEVVTQRSETARDEPAQRRIAA
jgi:hypothetical protein